MNHTISTTLNVLRLAAHCLPGATVQVDRETMPLPNGREIFTINELDRSGNVVTPARLHILADANGYHRVVPGSDLHAIATRTTNTTTEIETIL